VGQPKKNDVLQKPVGVAPGRFADYMRLLAFATVFVLSMTVIAEAASVKIENDTGRQIDHVYISPAAAETWGHDQLGKQQVVAPGEIWRFSFVSGNICSWDLRITFHDGKHHTVRHQNICQFADPIWRISH
jgi:hypothetical protein